MQIVEVDVLVIVETLVDIWMDVDVPLMTVFVTGQVVSVV